MWHNIDFVSTAGFVQFIVKGIFGCVAAVACGLLYGIYLSTYHDRKFWFSTRQVGAGVLCSSFRFDGLPMWILHFSSCQRSSNENSPFKKAAAFTTITTSICWQRRRLNEVGNGGLLDADRHALGETVALISSPNCNFSGLLDLILDNKTISGQTINVVQRLSLYPELITSFIYRVTNSQVRLWLPSKKNNSVQLSNAEMTSSQLFLLPSDSSSLGCRGANLLLRGDGPWAAGGLCHRLVCLQLGDERHLGGWGVDGGLVCDQQVKWRRFCSFFLHTCPCFSAVFVLKVSLTDRTRAK